MTREELSKLICAELPRLQQRDKGIAPTEAMLATWAHELTDKFRTPVIVMLTPSTTERGASALVAYQVPQPAPLPYCAERGCDVLVEIQGARCRECISRLSGTEQGK